MADDQQQAQEKTEQPTAKRLQDARKKGQIARSKELTMTIVMLTGAAMMYLSGSGLITSVSEILVQGLSFDAETLDKGTALTGRFLDVMLEAVLALMPLFLVLIVAALLGGAALGGWAFSTEVLKPKFSKLNPLSGLKRVFGMNGLVEMLKAIGKAAVVAACAIGVFAFVASQVLELGKSTLQSGLVTAGHMLATTFIACSASLALIALADVPYQIFSHRKKLRMTRKEIKDELKETEGSPEVRSRLRGMQQELASRRMLEHVPEADVVITNPTHFSVALKYDEATMAAPVVLAAGVDHLAFRIRDIARTNEIPLFESPVLARALYATASLNKEIDPRMYVAVAQVLTYIYKLRAANEHYLPQPDLPSVEISDELEQIADDVK